MKIRFSRCLITALLPGLLHFARAEPTATDINKSAPLTNSLGMKFIPVAGTKVLFSVWETRIQDFSVFLKETGRDFNTPRDWATPDFQQTPAHPVVMINWHIAVDFCEWLSKKEGREYRLPTDAEWSVAAGLGAEIEGSPEEKGKITGKLQIYPWGKLWPPTRGTGNYADVSADKKFPGSPFIAGYDDGFESTSPVGSFSANSFGLSDLSGTPGNGVGIGPMRKLRSGSSAVVLGIMETSISYVQAIA